MSQEALVGGIDIKVAASYSKVNRVFRLCGESWKRGCPWLVAVGGELAIGDRGCCMFLCGGPCSIF